MNKAAIIAGINSCAMWGLSAFVWSTDPVASGILAILATVNVITALIYFK